MCNYRGALSCLVLACVLLSIDVCGQMVKEEGSDEDTCYYTFVVPGREECTVNTEKIESLEQRVSTQERKLSRLNEQLQIAKMLSDAGSPYGQNEPRFYDCDAVGDHNNTENGVYILRPKSCHSSFHAYCQFSNDNSWTVIQRRSDGSVNFRRGWHEYSQGFGNWRGEYWLGNEKIYHLTNQADYKLLVELEDWEGNKAFAQYREFWLDSESENYRLHVGGYSGNAGDSLGYHSGQFFSTLDRDNDKRTTGSCESMCKGGWWYKDCYNSNLNSLYYKGGPYPMARWDGLDWGGWRGYHYSLKTVIMKIQRK